MLDITNNNTSDWLQGELRKLFDDNDIDALYLDLGKFSVLLILFFKKPIQFDTDNVFPDIF